MAQPVSPQFKGLDMVAFCVTISLILLGWCMIYSVGYGDGYSDSISEFLRTIAGRQAIFVGISILLFVAIMIIDWKFWRTFSTPIYIGSLGLLVLVLLFGHEINGAKAWFRIFGFSLQPSEIAKFGTSLALSDYLATVRLSTPSRRMYFYIAILLGAPMALIVLQNDMGSVLIFSSFMIALFRNGLHSSVPLILIYFGIILIVGIVALMSGILLVLLLMGSIVICFSQRNRLIWLGLSILMSISATIVYGLDLRTEALVGAGLFFGVTAFIYVRDQAYTLPITISSMIAVGMLCAFSSKYIFDNVLKPHHQERINIWLQPEKSDPYGRLLNLTQSKVAIGSGGWFGKGYLQGDMTKLNYVSMQETDFIFSSIGEEHGFIGSALVIGLFMILLWRIIGMAEKQRNDFTRNYAYCVAGLIFIHVMINIGMTMGLFPVIGIPLPFISKGGSSLLGFTLLMGVLLKLDQHTKSI